MLSHKFQVSDALTGVRREVEVIPDQYGFTINVADRIVVVDFCGNRMGICEMDAFEQPLEHAALHVDFAEIEEGHRLS